MEPATAAKAGVARESRLRVILGPAPFVATELVAVYGSWWPVACYAIFLAMCTVIAIWISPETYQEDIAADSVIQDVVPAAFPQRA
jgi:hypothetical protein